MKLGIAALALFCQLSACAQTPDPPPAQLFVLGDSLSDVGNAAAVGDLTLLGEVAAEAEAGLCNPADVLLDRGCEDVVYRRSRVSNGPVAVEHLAAHLGLPELQASFHTVPDRPLMGTNYAVAGAKARETGPADLVTQLDMLALDHGPMLPADALYVVMIGGNDVIDAAQAATDPGENADQAPPEEAQPNEESNVIVTAAVAAVGDAVERLLDAGAERVLVANVPDLAALPAVRSRAAEQGDAEGLLELATAISVSFNHQLAERLNAIEAARAPRRIGRFDFFAFLNEARAAAAENGINVLEACFDSASYRDSFIGERKFHPDCAPENDVPRFENFFFWDGIHPTGAVHEATGEALLQSYQALVGAIDPS